MSETNGTEAPGDNPKPLIYAAMNKIMFEIGSIGKTKTNTHFNYKFRGIDDVMNALHPHLAANGVFFVPKVVSHQVGDRGGKNHASVVMAYSFYATDGSSIEAEIPAEGIDQGGDKATNKALSAALKYLLLQVFCIPTEDMEEGDYDDRPARQPQQQTARKPTPTGGASQTARAGSNSTAQPSPAADSTSTDGGEALREKHLVDVREVCRQLNALGDTIKWTPAATKKFINEQFQVADGLDSLSTESFRKLLSILNLRLDGLSQRKES